MGNIESYFLLKKMFRKMVFEQKVFYFFSPPLVKALARGARKNNKSFFFKDHFLKFFLAKKNLSMFHIEQPIYPIFDQIKNFCSKIRRIWEISLTKFFFPYFFSFCFPPFRWGSKTFNLWFCSTCLLSQSPVEVK